jgi:DNA polymerase III subunit epsilon
VLTPPVTELHKFCGLERPLVLFDLETTGKRSATARIVQLAFVKVLPSGDARRFKTLVNPGRPIPAEATATHGITDDMVAGAPAFGEIGARFAKTLEDCDYGGYNIRYDLEVTQAELDRQCRIRWDWEGARLLDGLRLWQLLEPRTLGDFVERFLGRRLDGAHDAGADIEATAEGIEAVLAEGRLPGGGWLPQTMQGLHDLQFPRDPDWIDAKGKIAWDQHEAILTFGKHKGTALRRLDRGYMQWMLRGDFQDDTKQIIRDALQGRFPQEDEDVGIDEAGQGDRQQGVAADGVGGGEAGPGGGEGPPL